MCSKLSAVCTTTRQADGLVVPSNNPLDLVNDRRENTDVSAKSSIDYVVTREMHALLRWSQQAVMTYSYNVVCGR
jgi:hypothetical protein